MSFLRFNYKSLFSFWLMLLLFLRVDVFAGDSIEYSSAYANFIIGLIKNTEIAKKGTVCALGSDAISKSILNQDKKYIDLGNRFNTSDLDKCKVVYISESMQKGLRSEMDKLNSKNIFSIAIFDGFTESGGMVQVQLGRRNFELIVNPKTIKKAKVKFSALAASLVIN